MTRLDQELVNRGLARSRTVAATLIKSGRITVGGTPAHKPAQAVDGLVELTVLPGQETEYVSRAGHKLAGALACFPSVTVAQKRCLDAGASTGGFTDVLLRNGAARVAAVDVGHGQLVEALRHDPRVDVHEGLNIRYLDPAQIGGAAELTVCDLSFISLTLVMAPLAGATLPGGDLLLMVKPQFEVGRERLARTGVVSSDQERRRAVGLVAHAAVSSGLLLQGLKVSSLPGQDGNLEYFLHAVKPVSGAAHKIEEQDAAVDALLATLWP